MTSQIINSEQFGVYTEKISLNNLQRDIVKPKKPLIYYSADYHSIFYDFGYV